MKVAVEFEGGRVRPVKFWERGREYEVRRVNLVFERKDGGRKYLCFAVETGGAVAELRLDLQNLKFEVLNLNSIC